MGRALSVILALFIAVTAVATMSVLPKSPWFEALPSLSRLAVTGGVIALAGLLACGSVGFIYDRSVRQLRAYAARASSPENEGTPVPVSFLFRGLARSVEDLITEAADREHRLSEKFRDLRVIHRITETERNQLQGVLHSLRDAVIVTDAFDEVITLNRAAAKVIGVASDEASRQPIAELFSDDRLCQAIREARETGDLQETRAIEHDFAVGDRTTAYQVLLSCLPNNKGEVGAVVTILRDLRREREIAQMKSDFVSKASHELRTPLSSIRAYVEMLVDGEAEDEESRHEFYGIIQSESDRLARMIDNMLNISRIEAGIVQIERELVDFRPLLERAIETMEPHAKEKNISLSIKTPPVDLTGEGDEDMLYQVILNLVSNSIKYSPDGGRVTLGADSDNLTRCIVVTVNDTGLGIPPDAIPRLFDKFYRIENFKRVAKGTGLGLNLCKHIVETVHHGQIGVESKLGMGSKFWFTIPMKFAGAQAA